MRAEFVGVMDGFSSGIDIQVLCSGAVW